MRHSPWSSANGKMILFGEHAVVYGVEALAAAIPNMVRARAHQATRPEISIPTWGVKAFLDSAEPDLLKSMAKLIVRELGLTSEGFLLEVDSCVPPGSGLGASAALAVAVIRALSALFDIQLSQAEVNELAFKSEQLAHGTPSGLDNTLATYGGVIRFKRHDSRINFSPIKVHRALDILVALSGKQGFTAETVERVRAARQNEPERFTELFAKIGRLTEGGIDALARNDRQVFAQYLSQNQSYLRDVGVSCDEIEQVLTIAISNGCIGGKLTGSGDGGAVILMADKATNKVESALNAAGFKTLRAQISAQ